MVSEPFDIVVMDMKMPGMNGVESFVEMKRLRPELKVILVTAYSVESMVRHALEEGVYAVLDKPLDIRRLFDRIEQARKAGKGGFILVADDDRAFCDNLRDVLTNEGFNVMTAYDGAEAVRRAESSPFDILLIDMKLPILNGLETYRRIKQVKPDTIAVAISGYADEMGSFIRQILSESAHSFLCKPLDMRHLLGLMETLCSAKRAGTYKKTPEPQP